MFVASHTIHSLSRSGSSSTKIKNSSLRRISYFVSALGSRNVTINNPTLRANKASFREAEELQHFAQPKQDMTTLTHMRFLGRLHSGRKHTLPFSRYTHSSANPMRLQTHDATVHLLGTMHIAEASAAAARHLIVHEHAKGTLGGVFLELDRSRFARLKDAAENVDESILSHALSILSRPGRSPAAKLVELGLGGVYRSLHKLGFASGVEFKAAIETAERLDVPILLGDQDIKITLQRLAESFRNDFDLSRLLSLMMAQAQPPTTESPIERSIREAFQAMASGDVEQGQQRLAKLIDHETVQHIIKPMKIFLPNVTRAILYERDVVMTNNLIKSVKELPQSKRNIVAVVGMAHVEGIAEEWERNQSHSEVV